MSEKWLTSRVIENRHWTETLFSLRLDGAPLERGAREPVLRRAQGRPGRRGGLSD